MGMSYLVDWNYNGIGDIILGHGYQIKTIEEVSLYLAGEYTSPDQLQISLLEGWNLIGYLRINPSNCTDVFNMISSEIILVKDYLGNAYLADWDFNGIGDLEPGQG